MRVGTFTHSRYASVEPDCLVFTDEFGGPLRYSYWRRRICSLG
jgi:hypothetical protein